MVGPGVDVERVGFLFFNPPDVVFFSYNLIKSVC